MWYNIPMGDLKIRGLPDDLHYRFKVICVKKKISMNQVLKDFIKKFVEENEEQ